MSACVCVFGTDSLKQQVAKFIRNPSKHIEAALNRQHKSRQHFFAKRILNVVTAKTMNESRTMGKAMLTKGMAWETFSL